MKRRQHELPQLCVAAEELLRTIDLTRATLQCLRQRLVVCRQRLAVLVDALLTRRLRDRRLTRDRAVCKVECVVIVLLVGRVLRVGAEPARPLRLDAEVGTRLRDAIRIL